jgi:hypothetical protein
VSCHHPAQTTGSGEPYCSLCGARLVLGPDEAASALRRPLVVPAVAVLDLLFAVLCLYGLQWLLVEALRRDAELALLALLPGLGAIAGLFGCWGLLRLRPWARGLQTGLATAGLLLFPLGTLLGTAVLSYLLLPGVRVLLSGVGPEGLSATQVQALQQLPSAGRGPVQAIWALTGLAVLGAAALGAALMLRQLFSLTGAGP